MNDVSMTISDDERCIDLHAHTTASDGDHSPTALVELAASISLKALAVTDHDTTDGIAEAMIAGTRLGIEVVPGIELSAEPVRGQCHILGLYIDPAYPPLLDRLKQVIQNRNTRNQRIVDKMRNELGLDVTLKEVEAVAGGDVVARPHFARVLINKGYVSSNQEAFDVYLAQGGKAYVGRDRLTAAEAINLIHAAGGVAILAHPNNMKMNSVEAETEITRLKSLGLDGIEARYNRHSEDDTSRYLSLANRLSLITSGGSDFHGLTVKPNVFLGHVENGRPAPYTILETIHSARPES